MHQSKPALALLALSLASSGILPAASTAPDGYHPVYHEPVARSLEGPQGLYFSRLAGSAPWNEQQPGYVVLVDITFNELGEREDARIYASDDLTPGGILNQVALQLAAHVRQPPRLKDGKPAKFTARVPFHFPVEGDEGPAADQGPRPRLLTASPLMFPQELANRRESGGAILELIIGATGQVQKVKVLDASHEACGEAAAAAVKSWVFDPALQEGKPVKSRWRLAVAYTADGQAGELKWRLAPRPSLGSYAVTLPATPPAANLTPPTAP